MSAVFDFQGLLVVVLLMICTCSYLRPRLGNFIHPKASGFLGVFGRFAVIGDRLSPFVSGACVTMAMTT
eukprot:CAMPEP_0115509014 /NCGR_PEP_ID=MMETSP0271-20121206/72619_1 /TAXON_ID=71861 /ORGANISM="Scrippsiella trochoidea, Strain CCMP3099" /LENGTH=68 /DNA_ID=CAMNT_0002938815 /DNA_START=36 /DNA_END=239 /DNA_ORIENTATION=+